MSNFSHRLFIFAIVVLALTVFCRLSPGQTSPDLLVKPWDPGQAVDTSSEGTFEAAGHTKETDTTIRISSIREFGRWRIFPDSDATPRLGYDALYYDVQSHDSILPRHLFDGSVGFAQPIGLVNKWFVVLTGAIGYAGNSPFDDPHATYTRDNIIVGRKFSDDHAILVALNYDGNRTFLPDAPIPGFAFTNRYNGQLKYVVGMPYSSITYEPADGFQLEGGYSLLTTFEARMGYEFIKHFTFYGNYSDRLNPFRVDKMRVDSRLFFHTQQLEFGLRWDPTKLVRLSVGGGWAFNQEFTQGFDSRHLIPVRHLSDAPFARVLIELGF